MYLYKIEYKNLNCPMQYCFLRFRFRNIDSGRAGRAFFHLQKTEAKMKKTTATKFRRAVSALALPLLLSALIPSCADGNSGSTDNQEKPQSIPEPPEESPQNDEPNTDITGTKDERDSESVYANTWMLNHVQYAKAKSTVFTDRACYFTGPFQFLNFPAKESKSLVFTVTELPETS